MSRFSIGKLMILVAIVGGYVAVSRHLVDAMNSGPGANFMLPVVLGLLPMMAILVASAASIASRHRYSLARRDRPDFVASFFSCGLPIFAISAMVHVLAPAAMLGWLEWSWPPIEEFLESMGLKPDFDGRLGAYGLVPAIYGAYLSGPPLLLTAALAAFTSRYRIVVTPRDGATP